MPAQPLNTPEPKTPLEHEDRAPWTIQQTLLGIILTLVPWLALSFALNSLGGGSTPRATGRLSPAQDISSAVLVVISTLIVEGAFLIAPLYYARHTLYRRSGSPPSLRQMLRALGFRGFRVGNAVLLIIVFMVLMLAVNFAYGELITYFHLPLQTNDEVILHESRIAPITTSALLVTAVVVAPFCEEVFFRSFVFQGLRNGATVGWAAFLSALIFGLAHADLASFPVLAIIGLFLAVLRWRTRSIYPGMLLHILNNGISAVTIVLAMLGLMR